MLFEVEDISCDKCSDKIEQAIRAADPTAQITVKTDEKRVRVEGVLTA
ncbi:MAG: cation transporter, partial [Lysobacter sp.]